MTDATKYRDIRSAFWKTHFRTALDYESYLESSDPKRAAHWRTLAEKIPELSTEQTKRVQGHGRELNVLMVSGVWCGDCVRQGPMVRQIADACGDSVELRIIDRDESEALRDEVRILGALRVPVVVFLSEDFHEVGRFGDRMLTTYRRKLATEIGAACAVPTAELPAEELRSERDEWLDVFERMLLMVRLAPVLRERHAD